MLAVLIQGYCYAELAVSLVRPTPVLIVCTHGVMSRLSRPGWLWLNTKMAYSRTVTHHHAHHSANGIHEEQYAQYLYMYTNLDYRICTN